MTRTKFIVASLAHYWRTNLAVVGGIAAAVMVLGGALLVGTSVRGSLRDLVLTRIGRTDLAVVATDFFRAALADEVREGGFPAAAPMIALQGVAIEQATNRRASKVWVYGVDERFARFHGVVAGAGPFAELFRAANGAGRDVLLSPALAREIGAELGSAVLIRVQRPSDIPLESLHARKDDLGQTVRLVVRGFPSAADLGEFSLQPHQGDVRAAFVPLARLQQELGAAERANVLLVQDASPAHGARALDEVVRTRATLADFGLKLRMLAAQDRLTLESDAGLIDPQKAAAVATAAAAVNLQQQPIFTYLVNTIRHRDRTIPYSLVTGLDLAALAPDTVREEPATAPIVLNEWAARDLGAERGDPIALEYFVWEDPGRLVTRATAFHVAAVVPLAGPAADRELAPTYPGITGSNTLRDWNPPFPIDLGRIRPADEAYWDAYRATPKAFIPLEVAQTLWGSRYGALTSVRLASAPGVRLDAAAERFAASLQASVAQASGTLMVRDIRTEGLAASRGATDFGEYFTYFSFFLVASAIVLASLFFKLGVEQRAREVGILRAVGFSPRAVRSVFGAEALALALVGSAIGTAGALGYGQLMVVGLTRWWVDAVGTTSLRLHASAPALAGAAAAGVVAAVLCTWWTLRALGHVSERRLLAGFIEGDRSSKAARTRGPALAAAALALVGFMLVALGAAQLLPRAAAFFAAGACLLGAMLCATAWRLRRPAPAPIVGHGWPSVAKLGFRNAAHRPGRSVLSVAVIAAATFILISVSAFRRDQHVDTSSPRSGAGGYSVLVDLVLPLAYHPDSPEGRQLIGLPDRHVESDVLITPFRVLPGDDASCLNLYEPRQPRILAVTKEFAASNRFTFRGALGKSAVHENAWLLLDGQQEDGAIPIAADANSMAYVLHKALGDDIVIERGGRRITLRLVAALSDSIFQGEVLMSETNFRDLFPDVDGYQLLLVQTGRPAGDIVASLEDRLEDFGADAIATADRLAEFHQVENTYLSTFQTLGGLGLLLGTVGLAAVLLRNVLERRRELALLGAVGFGRTHLLLIVVAETVMLVIAGLGVGAVSAFVAIAPAAFERGALVPLGTGAGLLLFAVFATGLIVSVVATRAALGARLLDALRAE
jgi:ABC-type antimicrobial peptide transport system permease subunit